MLWGEPPPKEKKTNKSDVWSLGIALVQNPKPYTLHPKP
jgi:hypothetical protein